MSNGATSASFQAGTVMAACYLEIERRNKAYAEKRERAAREWVVYDQEIEKSLYKRLIHRFFFKRKQPLTYEQALLDWDDMRREWGITGPNMERLKQILTMAENCDVSEDGIGISVVLSAEDAAEVFQSKSGFGHKKK